MTGRHDPVLAAVAASVALLIVFSGIGGGIGAVLFTPRKHVE